MQLARLAVKTWTVVVVYPVSDVACFLDFSKIATAAYGVDPSCRQEKHIAFLYVITGQGIGDMPVVDIFDISFRIQLLLHSAEKMRTWPCADDVPHLGLALASVPCGCDFVIGMHLYAQVIVGINELDEQRKLPRIYICNLLARIGAFAYNGLVARDTRKNPAFGAPDKSLEYRFKFVHWLWYRRYSSNT